MTEMMRTKPTTFTVQLPATVIYKQKITAINNSGKYNNCDRAYLMLHNLQWFLDFKEKYNLPLDQEEKAFLDTCLASVKDYRAATKADYDLHITTISDGISNRTFWPQIEGNARELAEELQAESRELFARMKALYKSKNPEFKEDEFVVGKSMIDFQKDFSLDALGYTGDDSNAALGVSKTEQIIETAIQAIFATLDSRTLVYSRDMHTPHELGGSIWDTHWTSGDASTRRRIPFTKTQIATPLDAKVIADHPKCGDLCWGVHCQRNHAGSDYVRELPLNPDSMHIFKGTTFNDHPYGAGRFIADYFHGIGINISSLYGWATNFCVATTGQELLAANIRIIPVRSGCAGITIPGQISPDTDESTVLACFVAPGNRKIAKIAREMGMRVLGEDDIAYTELVHIVANEQEVAAFMHDLYQASVTSAKPKVGTM